jgi:hypothetical protein
VIGDVQVVVVNVMRASEKDWLEEERGSSRPRCLKESTVQEAVLGDIILSMRGFATST